MVTQSRCAARAHRPRCWRNTRRRARHRSALGEAGATVICTGRTSTTRSLPSDYPHRAETIEETAALVTRPGGTGIVIAVDHLDTQQVHALTEQLHREHGRIDVLVND